MFLVAANTRQALVGQKEWITTGSSGIQVQFLFSDDWEGLSKFAVFRNAEIEESRIPIALPASGLTELPAENCAAEYVDEKVYVGVYGSDGLGHIIIPTIWVSLGVLKEGAAYEGMDPPQPTPDMWAQILAIAQNAGEENAEAAEAAAGRAEEAAETAQEAAETAQEAAVHAPIIQNGYWYIWNDGQYVDTEVRAEGQKGDKGDTGEKGDTGNGIKSITKTGTSGLVDTYTVTYTDGTTTTFTVTNGAKGDKGDTGATGNGIASIEKTGTSGNVDTYTITYTNGQTVTFTVTNGAVSSVAGKTGAVVLNSGDIEYDDTETYGSGTVGAELTNLTRQINHFDDNLPGTVQTVNFGTDGKPSSVVHTKNGTTVRTDAYTWGDGTVTETRTTADGSYITMVTDLSTLITTISEIQEAS